MVETAENYSDFYDREMFHRIGASFRTESNFRTALLITMLLISKKEEHLGGKVVDHFLPSCIVSTLV